MFQILQKISIQNINVDVEKITICYKDLDLDLIISYRYRKEINKDTILFLHGFNGNSKSWAYQFNFFKNLKVTITDFFENWTKSALLCLLSAPQPSAQALSTDETDQF